MEHSLRVIKLYGGLADIAGTDSVELAGNTLQVLVSGLVSRFGIEIKKFISDNNFIIDVDDENVDENFVINRTELNGNVVHFYPCVEGAGRAGKIIAGITLLAVAFFFSPGITAALTSAGLSSTAATAVVSGIGQLGAGLLLQGLFGPQPVKSRAREDERPSFLFNGAVNSTEAGGPVPLVYGRFRTGSVVVSAGISEEELAGLTGVGNNNNSGTSPYGQNPFFNENNPLINP
jgi:predicted phage tail protein